MDSVASSPTPLPVPAAPAVSPRRRRRTTGHLSMGVLVWCGAAGKRAAILRDFDSAGFALQALPKMLSPGRLTVRLSIAERVVRVPVTLSWTDHEARFEFADRRPVAGFLGDLDALRPDLRKDFLRNTLGHAIAREE